MFGDVEILYQTAREAHAITIDECQLLVLARFDFKKLIEEFPQMGIKLKNRAYQRKTVEANKIEKL